eukprot:SAG31_NODE_31627_length_366_cov_0.576779_1_plen_118_part_01
MWKAKTLLDKLLNNILANPRHHKYRKVNTKNTTLATDLFGVAGAEILLRLAGFEPWHELSHDGSVLVLPVAAPGAELDRQLARLRQVQQAVLAAAEVSMSRSAASAGPPIIDSVIVAD